MDKRTRARELAMQALYQLDVQGPDLLEYLDNFFLENETNETVRKLARDWSRGTWENLAACDELISASTIKWRMSRLSPVDKSILRLAVYQLKFCPDVPTNISIKIWNEECLVPVALEGPALKVAGDENAPPPSFERTGEGLEVNPVTLRRPRQPCRASSWQGG